MLMDGGILNNTPISQAIDLGADHIVVLPAIGSERLAQVPRGAVGACVAALSRAITRRLADDLVRYADAAELIVLPSPEGGILPADFGHAEELIAEGRERAHAMLARRTRPAALRLVA